MYGAGDFSCCDSMDCVLFPRDDDREFERDPRESDFRISYSVG